MVKALVPESLNDITIAQMQRYESLTKNLEDTEDARKIMLNIFCGIDTEQYDRINASQLLEISQRIERILNTDARHELFFVMDDIRYGFIPNLDEITMGEFVDLENIGSEIKNWHKLMAVLYRPVTKTFGKRYLIADYAGIENAEKYKQMPLGVALGAMVFFWNLGKDLLSDTLKYLMEMEKEHLPNILLQENGIGLEQYTDSLKETLDELTRSQPYLYTHAYIGSATKQTYEN